MNLLFFIHSLHSGGAERVTANLANYWAEKGWQVTVVTLASRDLDFYELHASVKRIALDVAGKSDNALSAVLNNMRRIIALRKVLKQVQPDVALAMMSAANILLSLAAAGLNRLATIGSEHIYPPQIPLGKQWELLRRYLYARLDAVTGLTVESARWLAANTKAKRIEIIPNSATYPLEEQKPFLAIPDKKENERILLAVGRLANQKGFDWLIDVFGQLNADYPDWILVILGEGPERERLMAQVAENGLKDRVLMPGRAGNVGRWYETSDLYVMSSRFEGFGNTLAEAMSYGLPAVSFDCDAGPRDIIRHGEDGLLVPVGDCDALEEALRNLMSNDALRKQYATRAIEVRERFSIEKVAGMWEGLFCELGVRK